MSRKRVVAGVSVLTVILAGTVTCTWLLCPTVRAHKVLSSISDLQVDRSTFDDSRKVAASIGAIPSNACSPADCLWYIRIDNVAIPRIWRRREVSFSAEFQVRNAVLSERNFSMQVGTGQNVPLAEVEEQEHWRITPEPVFVTTQTTDGNPHYRVSVKLTPAAPPDVRRRYLSFNLNCLWKYGGCEDARDLLPTVDWQ